MEPSTRLRFDFPEMERKVTMNNTESVLTQSKLDQNKGNRLLMLSRILILLGKIFRERRIFVLAQSLAYTTIFTLVPILAAFFAVLGIIAGNEEVAVQIKDFIAQYFFPEYVNKIFIQFEKLTRASAVFGVIGFPTLFLAGVFLYVKVYTSINEIWLSEKKSMWFKNLMSFLMTLFFGPMILILVFSIPPYLQTIPYFQEFAAYVHLETVITQLIPILVIFAGLLVLYLYIPVISVRYSAAIKGAAFSAVLLQAGNYLVSFYLKSFSKLDVFYGSLAMFPLFLLWVYMIWTIVLTGAALAFIFHYHSRTAFLDAKGMYNNESLLCSSLQVMMYLVQSFQSKGSSPGFDQIQLMLGINRKRLAHILDTLVQEKIVIQFEEKSVKRHYITRFQLGVSPDKIKLHNLVPLFYAPEDHVVFNEELSELIKLLDIHPGFLVEDVSLKHLYDHPESMLENIKKAARTLETSEEDLREQVVNS